MTELLSIGDFSRMTFLTVKALRHYQQVGLLEPARTDRNTGYRYYRPEQVSQARLIRRLRDLDLPIDDVRSVLHAPDEATRNATGRAASASRRRAPWTVTRWARGGSRRSPSCTGSCGTRASSGPGRT